MQKDTKKILKRGQNAIKLLEQCNLVFQFNYMIQRREVSQFVGVKELPVKEHHTIIHTD